MSIVDKPHLQNVALGIWNKVQGKLNNYVHKTSENAVFGKTVLFDGYVGGEALVTLDNPGATNSMNSNTSYFSCTDLLVSANQKVGKVTIGVSDSKQIGETVTGVTIGAFNPSNNKVLDYIIQNGTAVVHANGNPNLGCNKAITVDVDATWILDVCLIVGANGALWGARNNNYGGGAAGGDTLPTVGSTLSLNPSGNYVGKVAVYGGTVALRDLANGSTSGVSRQEFNIHKLENSEQHQDLQNSINTTNNNVSTQSQRITNLENNSVRLNAQNRFTSKNIFENRSPIVDKYFSIKNIATSDGVDEVTYDGQYYCTPSEGIESGRHVHWLLLPIYNSQPGDTVNVSHFIVNAGSKVLVSDVSTSTYTVLDIQYRDHYCVAISINRTFSHSVSFGFRVEERIYPGRRLGLLKQYLPNQNNNNAWCSYNAPSNGQSVGSSNSKFTIPYVFAQKTQSEVVTRFDLANTTFPIDTAHLGELKFLAYDAGESVEINGRIWLKCNGQTLSSAEYGELYNEIGLRFNTKEEVTIRPTSEDGTEVAVEFNLPSNNSPVGYMYICAK